MSDKILKEAMADAKLLKETAIQHGQNLLVEAFSPKIKEYVDSQLEGSDDVSLELEPEEEGMYEANVEEMSESEEKEDEDNLEEVADEVVDINEEDIKEALKGMLESEINEATVSSGFGDVEDPTPKVSGGKQETGIADEKSGEHHWKDEEPPAKEDWTVESVVRKLKEAVRINNALRKENKQYKVALSQLKESLQEVSLFNTKLIHTHKLLSNYNLNTKQRVSVLEAFDRAQTMREVELTYKNISEAYENAGPLSEAKTKKARASRYTQPSGTSETLQESVDRETGANAWLSRQQRLAGILGE